MHALVLIFFASLYSVNLADDPCLCVSKYGIINLTGVGRQDGLPAFFDVIRPGDGNYKYSYNPCQPFSEGVGCPNVSVCQISQDNLYHVPLGTQQNVEWDDGTRTGVAPSITYTYEERKTQVTLLCTDTSVGELIPLGEAPVNTFSFLFRHRCACWNNCSYVPPLTTTPITTTKKLTTTTEKFTTIIANTTKTTEKTSQKPTVPPTTSMVSTTIPLDTASSGMAGHLLLTIVSLLFTLLFC